uniref:Uncharacterized protein n=1 Tax=Rhizophora mucronata TaxID=61149 RepID=A0A2P2IXC4_RHIMU
MCFFVVYAVVINYLDVELTMQFQSFYFAPF